LEREQKRATKIIPELSKNIYRTVKNLEFTNIEVRRYRGDMIELFRIIKGIYDSTCVPHVDFMELLEDLIRTRGNNYKLVQHHCHYDSRKFKLLTGNPQEIVCLIMLFLPIQLTLLKTV